MRSDGRASDQLRPVRLLTDFTENPLASVLCPRNHQSRNCIVRADRLTWEPGVKGFFLFIYPLVFVVLVGLPSGLVGASALVDKPVCGRPRRPIFPRLRMISEKAPYTFKSVSLWS